jgi:hypothetical protein
MCSNSFEGLLEDLFSIYRGAALDLVKNLQFSACVLSISKSILPSHETLQVSMCKFWL